MRIAITGASGRIGRYVIEELRSRHEVVAFDIVPLPEPYGSGVRCIIGDVRNLGEVEYVCREAEVVVHLAAIADPLRHPPEKVFAVNATGTYTVLEAAVRAGVRRVVVASCDAVLGFAFRRRDLLPEYLPIDERHPCRPQDPYGLSKLVSEEACRAFTRGYGLETICLRLCRVLFPQERDRLLNIVHTPEAAMNSLWAYVDVRDAARAFRLAAEWTFPEPKQVNEWRAPGHECCFIAARDALAAHDLSELVRRYYPGIEPVLPGLAGAGSVISGQRAERLLGFTPRFSWRDMV
jgi:nucleoside-diphosphate-sugar epimerase